MFIHQLAGFTWKILTKKNLSYNVLILHQKISLTHFLHHKQQTHYQKLHLLVTNAKIFTTRNSINQHIAQKHKKKEWKPSDPALNESEVFQKYVKECEIDIHQMDTVWNALNAKLKLPITPKVHTVTAHYIDYIRLTKQTLGETNDQAIESAHQEVNKTGHSQGLHWEVPKVIFVN